MNSALIKTKEIRLSLIEKAKELRREGISTRKISSLLKVAASTVLLWTSDIHLTDEQKRILKLRPGERFHSKEKAAKRRLKWIEEAKIQYKNLYRDAAFLVGISLYWGEGAKTSSQLVFVNSDPDMIKIWCDWCRRFLPSTNMRLVVMCHKDVDREKAKKFWSAVSGFKVEKTYNVYPRSSKGVRPRRRLPNGTLQIGMGVGSTEYHVKMMTWIDLLAKGLP